MMSPQSITSFSSTCCHWRGVTLPSKFSLCDQSYSASLWLESCREEDCGWYNFQGTFTTFFFPNIKALSHNQYQWVVSRWPRRDVCLIPKLLKFPISIFPLPNKNRNVDCFLHCGWGNYVITCLAYLAGPSLCNDLGLMPDPKCTHPSPELCLSEIATSGLRLELQGIQSSAVKWFYTLNFDTF